MKHVIELLTEQLELISDEIRYAEGEELKQLDCRNTEIGTALKILQLVSGVNTENEQALPIHIVRVCAWEDAADEDKVPFLEKAAELAGDSMFCTRVWSAWGVGTMSENDFVDAADDDDYVYEIAKAIWEGY
jgi:hypothetical protein